MIFATLLFLSCPVTKIPYYHVLSKYFYTFKGISVSGGGRPADLLCYWPPGREKPIRLDNTRDSQPGVCGVSRFCSVGYKKPPFRFSVDIHFRQK
jgi:hypothetical protein